VRCNARRVVWSFREPATKQVVDIAVGGFWVSPAESLSHHVDPRFLQGERYPQAARENTILLVHKLILPGQADNPARIDRLSGVKKEERDGNR